MIRPAVLFRIGTEVLFAGSRARSTSVVVFALRHCNHSLCREASQDDPQRGADLPREQNRAKERQSPVDGHRHSESDIHQSLIFAYATQLAWL
jgi:hypothetical protein